MAAIATGRQHSYGPYSESETVRNRGVAEAFLGVNPWQISAFNKPTSSQLDWDQDYKEANPLYQSRIIYAL